MTPTKNEIEEWLVEINKDRRWLAEELGTTYLSINQYMSKGFPEWASKSLVRLMYPANDKAGLEVEFSHSEWMKIQQAMKLAGYKTHVSFYEDAITEKAKEIIADHNKVEPMPGNLPSLKVAEEERGLGS